MTTQIYTIGRADESDFNITADGAFVFASKHSGWGSTYVARLVPVAGSILKFGRSFADTYEDRLSRAGNGDMAFGPLEDGVYEGSGVARSYESTKEYFEVRDGEFYSLNSLDEVLCKVHGVEQFALDNARAENERKRQEANKAAAEANASSGLTKLTGSEKQIGWAETIRAKKIESFNKEVIDMRERLAGLKTESVKAIQTSRIEIAETIIDWLKTVSKASFWIDRRSDSLNEFANYYTALVRKTA